MVSIEKIVEIGNKEKYAAATTEAITQALQDVDQKRERIQDMEKNLDPDQIKAYLGVDNGINDIRVLEEGKGGEHSYWGMFTTEVKLPEDAYRISSSDFYTPQELAKFFPESTITLVNSQKKYERILKKIEREFSDYATSESKQFSDPRMKRFIMITGDGEGIEKIMGVSFVYMGNVLYLRRLILNAQEREKKKKSFSFGILKL